MHGEEIPIDVDEQKHYFEKEENQLKNLLDDNGKNILDSYKSKIETAAEFLQEKKLINIMHFGIHVGLEIYDYWHNFDKKY